MRQVRQFFQVYGNLTDSVCQIGATHLPLSETMPKFTLSWSHYQVLMRIKNADERRFYEIEATSGNWSVREVQRQYNSSLNERLTLSRDKDSVIRLSRLGNTVEKPEDANIYASAYELYLPDKKILQAKVKQWIKEFEEHRHVESLPQTGSYSTAGTAGG